MYREIVLDDLQRIVQRESKVIVMFGKGSCGYCRKAKPKFEKASIDNPKYKFYYANPDTQEASRDFVGNIEGLPTYAGFRDGVLVSQIEGDDANNIYTILLDIANHDLNHPSSKSDTTML
tara:strand:+ start:4169 stop:4528 length:360 start_codon:yes stop_codon:yes gene_type:complete